VIATIIFSVTISAMIFTVWQQRRAQRLASVLPEQEQGTTVPSLHQGASSPA
jgi:hypothetical protein